MYSLVKERNMKKLLIILFCMLLLSACGSSTTHVVNGVPYDKIPSTYSLEAAKNDGLVVHEDYNITAGQTVWDEFIAETEKGNASAIRLMFYYTLAGQGITPEHEQYEEIKDDYPGFYIQDLSFDGNLYTLYWVEEEQEYLREYGYLKRFEDSSAIRYVLVNDHDVTWEQIVHGMFSSSFGAWIDFQTVYAQKTPL